MLWKDKINSKRWKSLYRMRDRAETWGSKNKRKDNSSVTRTLKSRKNNYTNQMLKQCFKWCSEKKLTRKEFFFQN